MHKADILLVTGAHNAVRKGAATLLEGNWGRADYIAFEGSARALADPEEEAHEVAKTQIEISIRLHEPDEIWIVGPTNWGLAVKEQRVLTIKEVQEAAIEAQQSVERAFPSYAGRVHIHNVPIGQLVHSISEDINTLVLGCIDLRYVRSMMDWIQSLLGGQAHLAAFAGATGAVSDPRTSAVIRRQVEILQPDMVFLRPHWDCGYFKGAGTTPQAKKAHFRCHYTEARKALKFFREEFGHLRIECHLMDPDGSIPLQAYT